MDTPLVIFGCGYIGGRLARAALAQGRVVRACARGAARLQPLAALGAEIKFIDAARPKQFGPALLGLTQPTVVYAVPPITEIPPGEAARRAAQASLTAGASCFIYLSTTGLFGDTPSEDWVDEDSHVVSDDPDMSPYLADESSVEAAAMAGLNGIILRLAAVYGPGKGVRPRLRKKDYKLLDDGAYWSSRIHVDDVVKAIFAVEDQTPPSQIYMVADDRPTTQREYVQFLCQRLGIPLPPSVQSYAPGKRRTAHRGRRVRNDKIKAELGITWSYPTYVEGETQVEAEEGGTAVPAPAPAPAPVAAPAPAPAAALPPERPAFIRHASKLQTETWSYPNSSESMAAYTGLSRPLGLTRLGVDLVRIKPGERSSWPHAHSEEEELAYVLEGTPDVWIDGRIYRLGPGDVVAWPPGTGIAHTVINNGTSDALVMSVGEARRPPDRIIYPLHAERNASLPDDRRWDGAPRAPLGPHDGLPDAQRKR